MTPQGTLYGWIYRRFMRFAHRHNWHHTTTLHLSNGDTHNWCQWCGMREVLRKDHLFGMPIVESEACPKNTIIITNLQVPKDWM